MLLCHFRKVLAAFDGFLQFLAFCFAVYEDMACCCLCHGVGFLDWDNKECVGIAEVEMLPAPAR